MSNIEDFLLSYEEKPQDSNINIALAHICFYDEGGNELVDYIGLKRCRQRNICRIYGPGNNLFPEDEWLPYAMLILGRFLPSDCVIWYCQDYTGVAHTCGFGAPYYCKYDPFGEKVNEKIAVCRVVDPLFQTNSRERYKGNDQDPSIFQNRSLSPTPKGKDVFDFVEKNKDNDDIIEIDVKFDGEDLEYIKRLIYGGKTVNEDGTMSQKEVSGELFLEYESDDEFNLKIEKGKNFNAHDEEQVRFVNGLVNFHTHPSDVYDSYDVDMMYPSPGDYISILTLMMQKYSFEKPGSALASPLLFSCIITIEGIYIVSLNKNYCLQRDRDNLREVICEDKGSFFDLKQSVKDSINSKCNGKSGFVYGKNGDHYFDTHCKYIGDPKDHPLGYRQIGGFDYDTYRHNRTEDQVTHFPESFEVDGAEYTRLEQAARDYCLKINRRELVTDVKFKKGPVLNVQFKTYSELSEGHFKVNVCTNETRHMPRQVLLDQETLDNIKLFFNIAFFNQT